MRHKLGLSVCVCVCVCQLTVEEERQEKAQLVLLVRKINIVTILKIFSTKNWKIDVFDNTSPMVVKVGGVCYLDTSLNVKRCWKLCSDIVKNTKMSTQASRQNIKVTFNYFEENV